MIKECAGHSGQILILTAIVVGLVLTSTLVIIGGSQNFFQNANYTKEADQAVNLAEAGVDKALDALNSSGGSYMGESETVLGPGSFFVAITTPNAATKIIESTGYIPSRTNPRAKRTVKITSSKGVGVSFNYGIQVGDGGLELSDNSIVRGSVYSNGNIDMKNNAKITGDVYVAGGIQATFDQYNDCSECADFIFGTSVSGNNRLDIAQAFKPSSTNVINKISLKLKKVGSPSDIIVRLLKDDNGKPDKNNVLASGVLTANLVTNQYNFIDVAFNSSPQLLVDNLYWIVVDTAFSPSNYWSWAADSTQGYFRGSPSWSRDWQARTPIWSSIPADLNFKTYMGGVATSIIGSNGVIIGGSAHANTLKNLTISQGAYYQVSQNITAGSYYSGSDDPPTRVLPISDANIAEWKVEAEDAGVFSGNISSCPSFLGPGKYSGSINISNNCTITIKSPVWITGNLNLSNGVVLRLDASYGSSSGVIVVDGNINFSNNIKLYGSGIGGSYLLALSTFDSRTSGIEAITISNNSNSGVLYAGLGIIDIANSGHMVEVTGWKIRLGNNVVVDYDSGLAGLFFSSGPSGSYSLMKGTYQVK